MATTARQELTTLHGYHSKAWSNKLHGYHSKARTNPAVWLPQQWSVCGERRRNLQSSKGQATGPRSSTTQALELYQRQILHIYIQSVYDLFWAPRYKSDILARTELRERERERGGGERERAAVWTKLTVSDVVRRVTEHTNACLQAVFDSILDAYWRHFWWFPNSEVCAVYVCHSYTQPYHHYHFFPLENQLLSW